MNIRQDKGITLVALVITIILMLIIAGISITGTIRGKDETVEAKQFSELNIVQHAILERYTKSKLTKEELPGENVSFTEVQQTINSINESAGGTIVLKGNDDEYKLLNKSALESLSITNASSEYIVNYTTGEVIDKTLKTSKSGKALYIYAVADDPKYIQSGLIVHYDGINNTGDGHSDKTTMWKDLSGNGNDGTLYGTDSNSWKSNYLYLDGVDDFVGKNNIEVDGSKGTIEIIAKYISGIYIFRSNASGQRTYIYRQGVAKGNPYVAVNFEIKDGYEENIASRVLKYYSNDNSSFFCSYFNNNKSNKNSYASTDNGSYIAIGSYFSNRVSQLASMNVYSVRVYNRDLTDEEIQHNYQIDKTRFDIQE